MENQNARTRAPSRPDDSTTDIPIFRTLEPSILILT